MRVHIKVHMLPVLLLLFPSRNICAVDWILDVVKPPASQIRTGDFSLLYPFCGQNMANQLNKEIKWLNFEFENLHLRSNSVFIYGELIDTGSFLLAGCWMSWRPQRPLQGQSAPHIHICAHQLSVRWHNEVLTWANTTLTVLLFSS